MPEMTFPNPTMKPVTAKISEEKGKMKTIVQKILCFLLCFSLLCLASCSIKAKPLGEEERAKLLAEAQILLAESEKVNALAFGEGIRPMEEGGLESGGYVLADAGSAALYGVFSTSDIKALFRTVYTEETSLWLEGRVLTSTKEEETGILVSSARYYDTEVEGESFLMVKKGYEPLLIGKATYSDLSLLEAEGEMALLSVTVTVEKDGEKQRTEGVSFILLHNGAGWRFDTFTGVTFDEGKK